MDVIQQLNVSPFCWGLKRFFFDFWYSFHLGNKFEVLKWLRQDGFAYNEKDLSVSEYVWKKAQHLISWSCPWDETV